MCLGTLIYSVLNQLNAAEEHVSINLFALKGWQLSSSTLHQTLNVNSCMSVISLCAMNRGMS